MSGLGLYLLNRMPAHKTCGHVILAHFPRWRQHHVYYIAEHIITDSVKFEEYRVKVAPMIASYGGRYITKAGSHKFPENPHWKPERVVIIEFPNMERLNAWYTSTEYQPLMALRKESTDEKDMVITVEGM